MKEINVLVDQKLEAEDLLKWEGELSENYT